MQIDEHLQSGLLAPAERALQIGPAAEHERFILIDAHHPVPDRDAHVRDTGCCQRLQIGLGDPAVPVLAQLAQRLIGACRSRGARGQSEAAVGAME